MDMKHMVKLPFILSLDLEELKRKEQTYQGSWKKRGGVGAFMMLARKWDRLENMCERTGWDIFKAVGTDTKAEDGTALAEIRDMRRYLALIEAEILGRAEEIPGPIPWPHDTLPEGYKHVDGTPKEDSNRHAAAITDAGEQLEKTIRAPQSRLPKVHSPRS